MGSLLFLLVFAFVGRVFALIDCGDGYTCFEPVGEEVVWVMKNDGNVNGPNCASVCSDALCGTGSFYVCDSSFPTLQNITVFEPVAEGLGFTCQNGGCWDSKAPGVGMMMVSIDGDTNKNCYFPEDTTYECNNNPGNANCYGERYSLVCPCFTRDLDEACSWNSPPNNAEMATWTERNGSSCLERINYWRKIACEEGWPECPPCGLPPMIECVCCHECANSQAQYDQINGAHASFTRCGDMVQGEGGGNDCAAVIDSFVAERQVFDDSDGEVVCRGHCGPIVSHGCQTFFWGKDKDSQFHTLNWRTCNEQKCNDYCGNPGENECFTHETSPEISMCGSRDNDIESNSSYIESLYGLLVFLGVFVGV